MSISVKNLSCKYFFSNDLVLRNVSFEVSPGESVCITGPSGCGKSTLLYCLNGIIPHALPSIMEGNVTIDSLNTREHEIYELSLRVGLVQQDPESQFRTLMVRDEIAFGMENLLVPRHEMIDRIRWSLQMIGAEHLIDRKMSELSGGEKQRIALAAALSMRPKVLLLDEPTSNLDPKGAAEFASNLRDIRSKMGLTIIIVEHRLDLFLPMSERLIVMNEGRILFDGPTSSVLQQGYDILLNIGIRYPQIFELFNNLCNCDNPRCSCPSGIPLSLEEAVEVLKEQIPFPFRCVCPQGRRGLAHGGDTIVDVEGLAYRYPGGFQALKGVSMKITRGEFVGIIGNNGSGKTTFLLHLIGILKPQAGRVIVLGMDTKTTPISMIAAKVGIVFQYPSQQLFEDSVMKEMLFAPRNFGMDMNIATIRSREILKALDLEGFEDRYPHSLSMGQMKRLNLASILTYDPDLIILDEPFYGQDYGHVKKILDILAKLNREKQKTILIVSHHIVELVEYVERLVLFKDGRIVEDGPTRHVLNSLVESEDKEFFCTPICRLAHHLSGCVNLEAPTTVKEMLSVLMEGEPS